MYFRLASGSVKPSNEYQSINKSMQAARLTDRHVVSFMWICDWRIFRLLPRFSHISANCTCRIFFPHKLAFSTAILMLMCFYCPFLLSFVTSTIWLPTEWHHPRVRTPVERDGAVGFKQFCTVFPPHIWRLNNPHIFNENAAWNWDAYTQTRKHTQHTSNPRTTNIS